MRRTLLVLSAACAVALGSAAALAQQAPAAGAAVAPAAARPLDAAERKAVIEELAGDLASNFVFADVGARYATTLRAKLARGDYDRLTDPVEFGKQVTADLQTVHSDGHLRLAPAEAFSLSAPAPRPAGSATHAAPAVNGLEETRMIGDVAYLKFNMFPDDPAQAAAARKFLLENADARAVIIDSRTNRGGGLAIMDAILPLLYPQPATLVRMDTRAAAANGPLPYASLKLQPSPPEIIRADHMVTPDAGERRLQTVPVYYLTARRTASAAEHLALAFKSSRRAILIGETTRGAGHFGGVGAIGNRFAAFIPVGRTYDPVSGQDWEGKGVAPDIAVAADQALEKALDLAAASPRRGVVDQAS